MVEVIRESAGILTEYSLQKIKELEPTASEGHSPVDLVQLRVDSHFPDLAVISSILFGG